MKRIRVNYGVTLNCGSYESVRCDASFETDIEEGKTIKETYDKAWKWVESEVSRKSTEFRGKVMG